MWRTALMLLCRLHTPLLLLGSSDMCSNFSQHQRTTALILEHEAKRWRALHDAYNVARKRQSPG